MLLCQAIKIFLSFFPTKKCRKVEDVSEVNNNVIPRVNLMKKNTKKTSFLYSTIILKDELTFVETIKMRGCCNILE